MTRVITAVLSACALFLMYYTAHAGGALDAFVGARSGNGEVFFSGGATEKMRCVRRGTLAGSTLTVHMRCASPSFKIDLHCTLNAVGEKLSGSCHEDNYGVAITVRGSVRAGTISASVQTDTGSTGRLIMPAIGSLSLVANDSKLATKFVANLQ